MSIFDKKDAETDMSDDFDSGLDDLEQGEGGGLSATPPAGASFGEPPAGKGRLKFLILLLAVVAAGGGYIYYSALSTESAPPPPMMAKKQPPLTAQSKNDFPPQPQPGAPAASAQKNASTAANDKNATSPANAQAAAAKSADAKGMTGQPVAKTDATAGKADTSAPASTPKAETTTAQKTAPTQDDNLSKPTAAEMAILKNAPALPAKKTAQVKPVKPAVAK